MVDREYARNVANDMSTHPLNLAFRFLLELSALAALAFWGWTRTSGDLRIVLAVGLPLCAATVWGTFAVPHDPSRSGSAPVPVSGALRLGIEALFFLCAAAGLYAAGAAIWSLLLALLTAFHYAASYDRVMWLVRSRS